MALPVMNAHVVSTPVFDINNSSATTHWQLSTAKDYALFAVAHAVDVSGMELAIQFSAAANTLLTQTIASAASTLELVVVDAEPQRVAQQPFNPVMTSPIPEQVVSQLTKLCLPAHLVLLTLMLTIG